MKHTLAALAIICSQEVMIFPIFHLALQTYSSLTHLVWNYLYMTCFELFYGLARALWTTGGPIPGRAAWHWTEWSQQVPQRPGWVLACYPSIFISASLWTLTKSIQCCLHTTLKPHPHTVSTFQFNLFRQVVNMVLNFPLSFSHFKMIIV